MPLRDHFHGNFGDRWSSFHHAWATFIAARLNEAILPPDYYALPDSKLGTSIEIDVGTFRTSAAPATPGPGTWAAPAPARTFAVAWDADDDLFEVRVYRRQGDIEDVVGAVELVSPANKDRPEARQAFAGKCAGYLRRGVGLVVVDIVTNRHHDFYRDMLDLLELTADADPFAADLSAVAYHTVTGGESHRLDVWTEELAVGRALPTPPLWLGKELAVPLELEATYDETFRKLRLA